MFCDSAFELRRQRGRGLANFVAPSSGGLRTALRELGRDEEARAAYRQGIEAAYRHGHPTMAMEFEEVLERVAG